MKQNKQTIREKFYKYLGGKRVRTAEDVADDLSIGKAGKGER